MKSYLKMSINELEIEKTKVLNEFEEIKKLNLTINMARGKPSPKQLDLSNPMLEIPFEELIETKDGVDSRNYGLLSGTAEAKTFFSQILEVPTENVFVGGNSSLSLMYSYISMAMNFGVLNNTPWNKLSKVKFLCPCPGYDRHFAMCEQFGIEMVPIKINSDGPDMQTIKQLTETDSSVKGIWCVPKYSNPTGVTYSNEVVTEFAKLKPAAVDFRIFWDNAYVVHNLKNKEDSLLNIFKVCSEFNSSNMVIEFASTSKITFPGAGISVLAASTENIKQFTNIIGKQMLCNDKINQLRHYKFLPTLDALKNHMTAHAEIITPLFELIQSKFNDEIKPHEIGSFSNPNGGYFVSFNSLNGCAKRIFELCSDAGVTLTNVGATFPYGKDPNDCNIRIAPTFLNLSELEIALNVFCVCTKIASIELLISKQ